MAKKRMPIAPGFKKSMRNRGEDVGQASRPLDVPYDNSPNYTSEYRPIKRREIRDIYGEMYKDEQERDQRSLDRVMDARNEFFAGIDPRRRQEVADAGMIQEDHNAIANLSGQPIHREFPKAGYYAMPYYDDLMRGGNLFDDNSEIF